MKREEMEKLIKDGLTVREIGEVLNCGRGCVYYNLKKYNLKTSNTVGSRPKEHKCKCGETNPKTFYGDDKLVCSNCHQKRVHAKGKENRLYVIEQLGGECVNCGFNKHHCSLDVHHLDPSKKDKNFNSMRGWSFERLDKEIKDCVLLCKNCHAAVHNNEIILGL